MSDTNTRNRHGHIAIDSMYQCLAEQDDAELRRRLTDMLKALPPGTLPLQSCCTQGGIVDETECTVGLLGYERVDWGVRVRADVFFIEVVGGCNCHDEPVRHNAYCVIEIGLKRRDGGIDIELVTN